MNSVAVPRKLIVLAIVLPLAAVVGYLLASPTDIDSLAFVGLLLLVLAIPVFLRWHHPLLVFSWNAALIIFFLPGSPNLWVLLAGGSFGLGVLNRILDKDRVLLNVPSVTWTLIILALVVYVTAILTGGAGLRSLGGSVFGGKKYFFIWFAVLAYFALSFQRIPLPKANFYVGMYLLSGLTAVLSNLIYMAGPSAWFLYAFFPTDWALSQAYDDFVGSPLTAKFSRVSGLSVAGLAAFPFLMMRYGVAGVLDWTKPWRLLILLAIVGLSLLGGFRSAIVFYGLLFGVQFCCEGLLKTRLFINVLLAGIVGFVALIPIAQKLPLSMQRSLSILPLPVSAVARADAQGSTEWRLEMWRALTPEIRKHFWRGKGFTASATDYYLAQESVRRNLTRDYEMTILAGDYHNGPLSLLIPFGIWGLLAFLAFVVAALRVLYCNQQYGDPAIRRINIFLLAFFITKLINFLAVFGAIHLDIQAFVGIVGLSVGLNGGVAKKQAASSAPPPDVRGGAA
jgi:hypothetical protein